MEKNQIIRRALLFAAEKSGEFIDLLEDQSLETEGLPKLTAVIQRLCEDDIIHVKPTFTARGPNFLIKLTDKGVELVGNKTKLQNCFPISEPHLCFVIMSFNSNNKNLVDIYAAIKRAVTTFGFECQRVDEIEENRRITDTIISAIQRSGLIVADLTESRPNCYYELGYAHALNKQVIQTCEHGTPLHFDISTYPTIVFETKTELEERLTGKIRERIDKGLVKNPMID